MKNKVLKSTSLWIIIIIIIWELISRIGIVSSYVFPPFSKILLTLLKELKNQILVSQVINSFRIVCLGLIISLFLSLLILVLIDKINILEYPIKTVCNVLAPLPSVAILPIVIIWMGINDNSMLVLVIHSILWPMIINLIEKVKSIPIVYHEYLENIEINSIKKVLYVYFLLMLPGIIASLKIGCSRAWRSIISSEAIFGMIGTTGGLGMYIYVNRAYGNMTKVMVGVLIIIIISIAINRFFEVIEKSTTVKWRMSHEK